MRTVIILLPALLLSAVLPASTPLTVAGFAPAAVLARAYALINLARDNARACGSESFQAAPPLAVSATLERTAALHAEDMARWNYFEHTGRDGSAPRDRLARAGYAARLTGENIAFGPDSAEEVVAGWLGSPGHCANLMNARFSAMGLAFSVEPRKHAVYWVLDQALPR